MISQLTNNKTINNKMITLNNNVSFPINDTFDFIYFDHDVNLTDCLVNSTSFEYLDRPDYDYLQCNDTIIKEMFSMEYRIVGTIFQSIILIVGLLGNIMVVSVVYKIKSMRTPTNCYLVSLSIADLMVLIAALPIELVAYYQEKYTWLWGNYGCKLSVFLQYLGINASSLNLIAFTVERYIAICKPMLAHRICTLNRARKILIYVWTFAVIYSSPWLYLTETHQIDGAAGRERCDFKLPRSYYLVYFFTDIIVFYVIPLVLTCILYILIVHTLLSSKNIKRNKGRLINQPGNLTNVKHHQIKNNSRAQVVKMLAAVVIVFATLWLPYRLMLVYNSFAAMLNHPKFMDLWFIMFAKTCVFINSAINPILYNSMSTKFRRAFARFLVCRSSPEYHNSTGRLSTVTSMTTSSVRRKVNVNLNTNGALVRRNTEIPVRRNTEF
uniref:Thyrotropin-releasing hormone receptor n=1 Tax=Cacopsylla melanoneura TaxID=428564 RepID=A0A8D9E628_9HEMI